ncbi:MAG: hypothetical protein H6741_21585 [Alphaproteobacteria bacterium]|nr:hypothetical protein [Alphaproteobacteria bacterium]MCB9795304.1 hypothetical protein [Alphaproteobacteria bacterium]
MLRAWVLLRLPLLALLALAFAAPVGDALAHLLITSGYPHGAAKFLVESWQILLFRQRELLPVLLAGGGAAAGLSLLSGRRWAAGAALVIGLGALALPWHHAFALLLGLALILLAGAPRVELQALPRPARLLAWLPGSELLLPSVVSGAIGLAGRRAHLALVGLGGAALAGLWLMGDSGLAYAHFRTAMAQWPAELTDPRVVILDRMPEWGRADFHGVDIVGDHALVVAEDRTELKAYPLDATGPSADVPTVRLATRWDGFIRAATLDSETDPETGLTWVLDGPDEVQELRWTGEAWEKVHRERFPFHLQYTYTRYDPDNGRLILAGVQAQERAPRLLAMVGVPGLTWSTITELRTPLGPMPVPREVEWIPSLQRLIVAPDFGRRLYQVDVDTGEATPWLEVPTLDGKMRWVPELQRLLLAIPNRPELWVIDPVKGEVERRVPTQPGVRSVALDVDRGLLLTTSVLTGAVLVQDFETGAVVDVFRTVMPMVRELKLHTGRGEAVLSTWTVLYKIPYATQDGASVSPSPEAP